MGEDVPWKPPRVVMQDLSGIPAIIDLSAMRDAVASLGGNPSRVNPLSPVDLVVDHSIIVDVARTSSALQRNEELEFQRNEERYAFLKWAKTAYDSMVIVPPGSGIIHQVNCEYLARVVMEQDGIAYMDGCIGTDSHTTMVNGVGVMGWGVGGIEAEAVMLGQPMSMVLPEVVGFRFTGRLSPGATATDLVLTVTKALRSHPGGVVGKFVEFFGEGVRSLAVTDRMTIANMCPEYGATMGYFSIDEFTLEYLRATGRTDEKLALIENYCKANGLFDIGEADGIQYSSTLELDLSRVVPCVAGPKRPHDYVALSSLKQDFVGCLASKRGFKGFGLKEEQVSQTFTVEADGQKYEVTHGSLAVAAITSCTNTSNPMVMIAAGLLAKRAFELGLSTPAYVKTSLAPGSKVVTEYLKSAGLEKYLDALGFHLVGYGCTTCVGNSGEVHPGMQAASDEGIVTAAILSGNRNFEGRVHLSCKANYLASPPLVVAGAIAGTVGVDFYKEPLGIGNRGKEVFLRDVWPSADEVESVMRAHVRPEMFRDVYGQIAEGSLTWEALEAPKGQMYCWDLKSTYIAKSPFLEGVPKEVSDLNLQVTDDAYCLLLLGDSITTDHISPVSKIMPGTPAARYLSDAGVDKKDWSNFGARRGNAEVMVRGTFANPQIINQLLGGEVGPRTVHVPTGDVLHVYDAAQRYQKEDADLVVIAGSDYGTGSSRDWAAKGTQLLGVKAVIARSFERIHRSNLVGMGIVPLAFHNGDDAVKLGLTGLERFAVKLPKDLQPGCDVEVTVSAADKSKRNFMTTLRLDTSVEITYYQHGGILPYVMRDLLR
jgi:aconitate hydratase